MSVRLQTEQERADHEREVTVRQIRKAKRQIDAGDRAAAIQTLSFLVDWLMAETRERIMNETETSTPEPEPTPPEPEPEEPEPEEPAS